AIFEGNTTQDLLLGSNATGSAKFAFINVNSNTPTASISANNGNNATYVTGGGVLGTTNGQTLQIGSASTGNLSFVSGATTALTIFPNGNLVMNNNSSLGSYDASGVAQPLLFLDSSNKAKLLSGAAGEMQIGLSSATNNNGIRFFTQNVERMRITHDGQVGINATTPAATLDVRASSATLAVASVSGSSNFANLVVDQSGTGDIFTASVSGATRFVINNAGNVGIGTSTPSHLLDVIGDAGANQLLTLQNTDASQGGAYIKFTDNLTTSQSYTMGIDTGNGTSKKFTIRNTTGSGPDSFILDQSGNILLGLNSSNNIPNAAATLDIRGNNTGAGTLPTASISAQSSFAGMVVDNSGTGDLFTASKSGATKFVINNAGNVQINNLTTNGGLLFTNGSGVISQTVAGSNGQCLVSLGGGAPNWASCGATGLWNQNAAQGTLFEGNTTEDLLLGGTATASARFAFTGMAGNATPVASIAATPSSGTSTGLSFNSTGAIQSLNKGTLTIGGNTTGDIAFNPGNVGVGNSLYLASNGKVGIGDSNPSQNLNVAGAIQIDNGHSGYFYNDDTGANVKLLVNGGGNWLGLQQDANNSFSF
ncbi:MAG TPA: hypothetical protein VNZ86_17300, partial [Bacteroidia bacterium]|nr:hypothetical protein [Bacteroidia bacterium]